ncbi:hypothetical protein J3R83DRAFT_3969 [Lanmaoa asiatica]|nr:hypothetical protein J3R83DRAFT_3969 [Lanmaoa asiatica]
MSTHSDELCVKENLLPSWLQLNSKRLQNQRNKGAHRIWQRSRPSLPSSLVLALVESMSLLHDSTLSKPPLHRISPVPSISGFLGMHSTNPSPVLSELFSEDLIHGCGLFMCSVMKAQASSLPFTSVFAALVAIINTKLPQVGE